MENPNQNEYHERLHADMKIRHKREDFDWSERTETLSKRFIIARLNEANLNLHNEIRDINNLRAAEWAIMFLVGACVGYIMALIVL